MEGMRPTDPRLGLMLAVLCTGVVACSAGGGGDGASPVELRFALADGEPLSYSAEYRQDVLLDMGDHAMEAGRRYEARYTITGAGSADGHHQGSVRLDSLRIAVTTAQGRQAFDTRHLIGDEFEMTVGEAGGAPAYGGDVPALDLGPMLGGEVGPTLLMDFGFPQLPDRPVSAGDTWQGTIHRTHVEGILAVTAELTATYTLAGWETANGVECARIEASISGDLSGLTEQHGASFDYSGTLQGTRVWLFDPSSGSVVRMDGEESTDGRMTSESVDAPVEQLTTVHIRTVGDS